MTIELALVIIVTVICVSVVALEYVKRKYPGDGS